MQAQALEEDGLVVGGAGDASPVEIHAAAGGHHHVDDSYQRQFRQQFAGIIAQARLAAQLPQSFPQHVGQEAHQDSCVDLGQFLPAGYTDSFAHGIDPDWDIVGYAIADGGAYPAMLWQPVP